MAIGGVSENLINSLGSGTNAAADAYNTRTQQLDAQRNEQEKQADADMLRVFEFAGDGYVDEARFYAQQKGLAVPEQVYTNADFAKGLSLAGKIYGDSPEQAQKFTQAWVTTKGDFNGRLNAAQQAAGPAVNPEDRQLQKQIALEQWKLKNRPASERRDIRSINNQLVEVLPDGSTKLLYNAGTAGFDPVDVGMKSYNSALGGFNDNPAQAAKDAVALAQELQGLYPQGGGLMAPPPAVQGTQPQTVLSNPPQQQQDVNSVRQRAVHDVQQLIMRGFTEDDIVNGLMSRGAPREAAEGLIRAAKGE